MATVKLFSLAVRTIAKPIASSIKNQTKQHPRFRNFCVGVAQTMHRTEMKLKMNFLGYKKEHIRPLSENKAVEMGANFISESILFSVAAGLILAENARSRKANKDRRNLVNDNIYVLQSQSAELSEMLRATQKQFQQISSEVKDLREEYEVVRKLLNEVLNASMGIKNGDKGHEGG
ncbi:uncharacterized protein VTP21DRAFT_4465 [Calcarisporiella thermophila]|uniref:uncharacterized protein n=1 Tax=Calcarisporiella thermophila TaxID=911321 RepID=UPI0037425B84